MFFLSDILEKILRNNALFYESDPCLTDRWKWLKKHLKSGPLKTLDAGCGNGAFSMYASNIGNTVTGISYNDENNQRAAAYAKMFNIKNINFITADLGNLSSSDIKDFDQVICFEVIEHIIEDSKLINNLNQILKKDGMLYLTTPYKNYKPLPGDKLSETEDGGHVRWGYTFEEMRKLLERNGFEVIHEEYISGYFSQEITALSRHLRKIYSGTLSWELTFPLRIFKVFDRPFTKLIKYPFCSIGVIAKKI